MSGAAQPASSRRCLISGTAAAASGTFTVTRTSSDPACASSKHCIAVEATSAVSVLVMDCTTMGAPPPTCTCPTFTPTVLCRVCVDICERSQVLKNRIIHFTAGERFSVCGTCLRLLFRSFSGFEQQGNDGGSDPVRRQARNCLNDCMRRNLPNGHSTCDR